jgi:Mg/Co/Ni transporter MgtE
MKSKSPSLLVMGLPICKIEITDMDYIQKTTSPLMQLIKNSVCWVVALLIIALITVDCIVSFHLARIKRILTSIF